MMNKIDNTKLKVFQTLKKGDVVKYAEDKKQLPILGTVISIENNIIIVTDLFGDEVHISMDNIRL